MTAPDLPHHRRPSTPVGRAPPPCNALPLQACYVLPFQACPMPSPAGPINGAPKASEAIALPTNPTLAVLEPREGALSGFKAAPRRESDPPPHWRKKTDDWRTMASKQAPGVLSTRLRYVSPSRQNNHRRAPSSGGRALPRFLGGAQILGKAQTSVAGADGHAGTNDRGRCPGLRRPHARDQRVVEAPTRG